MQHNQAPAGQFLKAREGRLEFLFPWLFLCLFQMFVAGRSASGNPDARRDGEDYAKLEKMLCPSAQNDSVVSLSDAKSPALPASQRSSAATRPNAGARSVDSSSSKAQPAVAPRSMEAIERVIAATGRPCHVGGQETQRQGIPPSRNVG